MEIPMIQLYEDREGRVPTDRLLSIRGVTPICGDVDSMRVDGELVWSRPKEKVRVHPDHGDWRFHSEVEIRGASFDLLYHEGAIPPHEAVTLYPPTYEEV